MSGTIQSFLSAIAPNFLAKGVSLCTSHLKYGILGRAAIIACRNGDYREASLRDDKLLKEVFPNHGGPCENNSCGVPYKAYIFVEADFGCSSSSVSGNFVLGFYERNKEHGDTTLSPSGKRILRNPDDKEITTPKFTRILIYADNVEIAMYDSSRNSINLEDR